MSHARAYLPRMTVTDIELSRAMAEDAVGYFLAAKKVAAGESPVTIIAHFRMPLNFLLGQCCELALKSMLTAKGWDRKRLDPIRHDLVGLRDAAIGEGITVTSEFADYCKIMGDAHKEFHFRYSGRASPAWIGHDSAFAMIAPQLRTIAPYGGI